MIVITFDDFINSIIKANDKKWKAVEQTKDKVVLETPYLGSTFQDCYFRQDALTDSLIRAIPEAELAYRVQCYEGESLKKDYFALIFKERGERIRLQCHVFIHERRHSFETSACYIDKDYRKNLNRLVMLDDGLFKKITILKNELMNLNEFRLQSLFL